MNRDINMGTENRTNEMNMDMTGRMPRAKKMRRRILALTCALAIALLQCAVIMTVGTEEVGAADDLKVSVEVTYKNDSEATKSNVGVSGGGGKETLTISEGETVKITGKKIDEILSDVSAKDSATGIKVDGVSVGVNDFIVTGVDKDEYKDALVGKLYKSGMGYEEIAESGRARVVTLKKDKMPVKFSKEPTISPSSPVVGNTVTISYSLEVDGFLKISDGYDENEVTKLKWSTSSDAITMPTNTETKGISGSLSGIKYNKPVTASVEVSSAGLAYIETKSVPISGKDKQDISKASVSVSENIVKGKKYTNSDLKEIISLSLNGSKIAKKYWTVTNHSTKNGKMTINIGLTKEGKKLYKGTTKTTVSLTTTTKKASTSKRNNNNNNNGNSPNGRTFATRSPGASTATTRTGTTTVPTVTYTPDRTITVKEVYLGQEIQEEQQQNPYEEMYEDPYATDESSTTNDWEDMDTSVDFGPAASSAAAAAAVCGAGAIGRIRRFRVDTKTVVSAASQAGNQTTAQTGPETEKKSRLSRFKKS